MFDRLGSQFARRPGVDRSPKFGWRETGQVDDLDNLFSAKAAGSASTWCIGQERGDQRAQIGGMLLNDGELGFGLGPAAAPFAHGRQTTRQRLGQRLVRLASSSAQDDAQSERKGLGAGMLAKQGIKHVVLWR